MFDTLQLFSKNFIDCFSIYCVLNEIEDIRTFLQSKLTLYPKLNVSFLIIAAEYGSVVCDGVPMADIPTELQDSRVFKLHLRGNGLHRFPDSKLEGTGKQ